MGSTVYKGVRKSDNLDAKGFQNFGGSKKREGCFPNAGMLQTMMHIVESPHLYQQHTRVQAKKGCRQIGTCITSWRAFWPQNQAAVSPPAQVVGHLPIPQSVRLSFRSLHPWKLLASLSQLARAIRHQHLRAQIPNLQCRWCCCYYCYYCCYCYRYCCY